MAFLSWSEQYLIGNPVIDNEHRELFLLINQVHNDWVETQDREVIARALTRMVEYAERHFQHEEAIMAQAGYPSLDEHQRVHETLIEQIFKLHHEYAHRGLRFESGTLKFLKTWLVGHILENDYQFRDFLRRTPSEPPAAADPAE